jgi:DNA-binding MarR family transcriptional regulator
MGSQESAVERCAEAVIEIVPLVMRFLRSEMRSQGSSWLSVPQLRSLIFLNRCPGSSLSNVADHLGVTRATASALVEKLVQLDLVYRTEDPQERRRHILNLTKSGVQQLNKVRAATCQSVAEVLANLSATQLQEIQAGLTLLGDTFNPQG